jgi:hypothetical protein
MFVGDDLSWATDAVGRRAIAYDLSYGGLAGYLVSERMSLNTKVMETRVVHSERDRPPTRLLMVGVAYLLGGHTPIDFGYKVSRVAASTPNHCSCRATFVGKVHQCGRSVHRLSDRAPVRGGARPHRRPAH